MQNAAPLRKWTAFLGLSAIAIRPISLSPVHLRSVTAFLKRTNMEQTRSVDLIYTHQAIPTWQAFAKTYVCAFCGKRGEYQELCIPVETETWADAK